MSQPTPDTVVFAADVGAVHIEKRYRLDKARYRLLLDVVVANGGDASVFSKLLLSSGGRQDPDKRGGGFFSGVSASVASALCYVNGKVHRKSIEELAKEPLEGGGRNRHRQLDRDRREVFLARGGPFPRGAAAAADVHGAREPAPTPAR